MLAGLPAGWVTVKVKVDVAPTTMVVGAKALVSTGVAGVTTRHWLPTLLVIPAVPVTLATALVFCAVPGHAPTVGAAAVVTLTVSVQTAVAPMVVLLVMVMLLEPATAVRVPAAIRQVPPSPFGVATIKPAGSVSV